MLCPHCGTENATAFGYCSACGKPLSVVEGVALPAPPGHTAGTAAGVAPAAVIAEPKPMSPVAMLAVAAVVIFIVFLGVVLPVSEENESVRAGYRIGRTFAALFLPGLIAYLIAGRKKARKPDQFALVFCVLGVLFTGADVLGSVNLDTSFETPEGHVGRLMREASGVQPVRESMFPSQRRTDEALRGQFRSLVRQNREYTEAVARLDTGKVKDVNSPQSFVDPDIAAAALQQLHALYDVDAAQEVKFKEILGNLRHTLESEATSAAERESILKDFDNGVAAQMSKREQAVAAEKSWIGGVDDEYAYAGQHSADFRLQQGRVAIYNTTVREEFNTRVRLQEARRKEFLAAQKEFNQFQLQLLQKMGVNPKDVGVQ